MLIAILFNVWFFTALALTVVFAAASALGHQETPKP
jgi:hypothetical protein